MIYSNTPHTEIKTGIAFFEENHVISHAVSPLYQQPFHILIQIMELHYQLLFISGASDQ